MLRPNLYLRKLLINVKHLYFKLPLNLQEKLNPFVFKLYLKTKKKFHIENISTISKIEDTISRPSNWLPNLRIEKLDGKLDKYDFTVFLPSLRTKSFSAGPMIAIQIAFYLKEAGSKVRVVAIDGSQSTYKIPEDEIRVILSDSLLRDVTLAELPEFQVPSSKIQISGEEKFIATAWWTFDLAANATKFNNFDEGPFYLIQDYETLLHDSSTESVLAEQTYFEASIPIFASDPLATFFKINKYEGVGLKVNSDDSTVIKLPLISRTSNRVPLPEMLTKMIDRKKVVLFYARPNTARRNLYELGLESLRLSVKRGYFDDDDWVFLALGAQGIDEDLGKGKRLISAPWLSYSSYLNLIQNSNMYLALMNAPHTNFPVIEAAQLGVPAVTSYFQTKNKKLLESISNYIYGSEPNLQDLVYAIRSAITQNKNLTINENYFAETQIELKRIAIWIKLKSQSESKKNRNSILSNCQICNKKDTNKISFSILVSIYNIKNEFLEDFFKSISRTVKYYSGDVELVILNNGSTIYEAGYIKSLAKTYIENFNFVDIETNVGIAAGMDILLNSAKNEFVIPVDADDLVTEDALFVLNKHYQSDITADFMYTNEFLLHENGQKTPSHRYYYDPILLKELCFTTHINCFRRNLALQLQIYKNAPDGSHDWYSAMLFQRISANFVFVNHFTYFWRQHSQSTALDWTSKSYIKESQTKVLRGFAESMQLVDFELEPHPYLFGGPNQIIKSNRDNIDLIEVKLRTLTTSNFNSYISNILELIGEPINETSIYYFCPENSEVKKEYLNELKTLYALYDDYLYTGSLKKIKGNSEVLPEEFEIDSPYILLEHYQLKTKCRRKVQGFNPLNFAISGKLLLRFIAEQKSFYGFLRAINQHIIDNKLRILTSPALTLTTDTENLIDQSNFLNDLTKSFRKIKLSTLETQSSRPHFSTVNFAEISQNSDLRVNIVTTLRSNSNLQFLYELFENLSEISSQEINWIVVIHGVPTEHTKKLTKEFNNYSWIDLKTVPAELELNEALEVAIENLSEEQLVTFIDYDDLVVIPTFNIFLEVLRSNRNSLVLGNEIQGKTGEPFKYFKRPIFPRLSFNLYSLVFHPIGTNVQSIKSVLNSDSSRVIDWQLTSNNNLPIIQLDLPVYYWRSHSESLTNNSFGNERTKSIVIKRLNDFSNQIEAQNDDWITKINFQNNEFNIRFYSKERLNICIKNNRENINQFTNLSYFLDFYDFKLCSQIECTHEATLYVGDGFKPSQHFDVEKALFISIQTRLNSVGKILGVKKSNLQLKYLNSPSSIRTNDFEELNGDFNVVYHYPMATFAQYSPRLVWNKDLPIGSSNLGVYVQSLDVEYLENI